MKSFIVEGKTIEEAVEKGWKSANCPKTFLIKVVDNGIKSFFWWRRSSFKITFSYEILSESENDIIKNKQSINSKNKKNEKFINNNETRYKKNVINSNVQLIDGLTTKKNNNNEYQEKNNKNYVNNKKNNLVIQQKENIDFKNNKFEVNEEIGICKEGNNNLIWQKEHIDFISCWISWVSKNFNLSSIIPEIKVEESNLKIYMGKSLFIDDSIKNKHLSSSIVVLLYETLKREFRNFDPRFYKITVIYE